MFRCGFFLALYVNIQDSVGSDQKCYLAFCMGSCYLLSMPLLDPSSIVNMHYNEITRFVKHRKDALLMLLRDPQRNRAMHNVSQKSCSED